MRVSWSASTDTGGSGLLGYKLWRNGTVVTTVNAPDTATTDTGLAAATGYLYEVSAFDKAGNQSARSTVAGATTPACGGSTNREPIADAGPDRSVVSLTSLTLSGANSRDTDGSVVSYSWNFGDGTSAAAMSASHASARPGTYTATLTVTDDDGASATDFAVVTVTNRVPIANIAPPAPVRAGVPVTLDGSGSSDPDGTIAGYEWSFGTGTGSGPTPTHTYSHAGVYSVTLRVTDDAGGIGTVSVSITVGAGNQSPLANAGAAQSALSLTPVTFDAGASRDDDGAIVEYRWDFGDGTTGTGVRPTHSYATPGFKSVRLTVIDDDGAQHSASTSASIGNRRPTAALTATPWVIRVGSMVTFDATVSFDPDGTLTEYRFGFGDGGSYVGPNAIVTHTYATPAVYVSGVSVKDDYAFSPMYNANTVQRAVVVVQNASLPLVDAGPDVSATVGTPVSFYAVASSDPNVGILNLTWDFGDGTIRSAAGATTHTFGAPGSYTVRLSLVDNLGQTATDTAVVTVR